ncbi:hypothetical protein HDZ31DRAFT_26441, partial [Schizophyllum fasciatum]
ADRGDLFRLSLLSKMWCDIANPVLWESIPGFEYLWALLPAVTLSAPGRDGFRKMTFKYSPTQDDWSPVLQRSCFVRFCGIVPDTKHPITLDFDAREQAFMVGRPPKTICPSLRELRLDLQDYAGEIELAFMLDALLAPTLTSLNLVGCAQPGTLSFNARQIAVTCSNLQSMKVQVMIANDINGRLGEFFDAFAGHASLSSVTLVTWDSLCKALKSLSQIPQLSYLNLHQEPGRYAGPSEPLPRFPPGSFPSLRTLTVRGRDVSIPTIHAMIDAWDRQPFSHLHLEQINSARWLPRLLDTTERLERHCDHASTLDIRIHADIYQARQVTLHDFAPLSSFPHLSILHFTNDDMASAMTDDDIGEMASWWPVIQELRIAPGGASDLDTLPTLASLSALARGCPRLSSLELPFGARSAPPTVARQLSLNKLRFMWYAPIGDPEGVAHFLRSTFPNLNRITMQAYHRKNLLLRGTYGTARAWKRVMARLAD